MSDGTRQDRWLITVSIDGVGALGTFDALDGGDADSGEQKYYPGGMLPQIVLGGPRTVSNVTANRLYDLPRDHAIATSLASKVGKARGTVTRQPLDVDGNPWGVGQTYSGILKTVKYPKADAQSGNAALLEITISTEGTIA